MKILSLIFLLLVTFSGCTSFSPEQCRSSDWSGFGESDASRGEAMRFSYWENHCSEYNMAPDSKTYEAGYQKGIKEYCTFQNGYIVGSSGRTIPKTCPLETQEAFTKGFIEGERSYTQRTMVSTQTQILQQNTLNNMSCQTNSDCRVLDRCINNSCERNQKYCSYQSDCTMNGSCVLDRCRF